VPFKSHEYPLADRESYGRMDNKLDDGYVIDVMYYHNEATQGSSMECDNDDA
jgi:hypothetical protein